MTRSARTTSSRVTSSWIATRPMAVGRTNGTRPALAFLSRESASSTFGTGRSETRGRGPTWSTAEAIASKLASGNRPRRRATKAAPIVPQPTASPCVKRR